MMETESNNSLPAFFNHFQATSYSIESKIVKEANKVQVETQ